MKVYVSYKERKCQYWILTESQQHQQFQDGNGVDVPTQLGEPAIFSDPMGLN